MSELAFIILCLLMIKHWVVDSLCQIPYMYKNKGHYGHPGGIMHSLEHGMATYLIILIIPPGGYYLAMIAATFDMVVHYHIDYIKVRLVRYFKCSAMVNGHLEVYDNKYFHLLILDQCLHFLTYLIIVFGIFDIFY